MKSDIPADELERALARVDQLLEALRRETERLGPEADSALTFHPDEAREGMTIAEAGGRCGRARISSVELTKECLDQIGKLNPVLNAFITVTGETALARAEVLDRELAQGIDRGPLHGIPIAHKDLMWTKGIRTTSGSKLFADFVPDRDAAVVEKLAEAGAVMVGKAGLHELAYGITSDNPHFGTIRNPRNPEHSPGGSSGGSAVAVATGMAFVATGTDTGGSIRVPASFCGVVGLKPTYGLIDRSGVQPLGLSLDHVGPMARTVDDVRLALDAMSDAGRAQTGSGFCSRDPRWTAGEFLF